jgi:transposase-like protein
MTISRPDTPPVNTPSSCPACGSAHLTTVGKAVGETTYWRCCTCGEVWNPQRRRIDRPLSRW